MRCGPLAEPAFLCTGQLAQTGGDMSARSSEALATALTMARRPQLVRVLRQSPLPRGVTLLLEVAAGETEALREAVAQTGTPEAQLRKAASFFVEQVLLTRKSDSYRVLGARRESSPAELRRHMALILKWLHPDRKAASEDGQKFDQSALAALVTTAWETIKNPERRAVYDAGLAPEPVKLRARGPALARGGGGKTPMHRRLSIQRIEREPLWSRLLGYLGRYR